MLTLRNNQPQAGSTNGRSFIDNWINEFFNDLGTFDRTRRHVVFPLQGTDIYEDKGNLVYEMEMPGLNRDDIKVRIEGDHLMVSGDVKRDENINENQYLNVGRRYGQFQRAFRLPQELVVDGKKVSAKLDNGILRVSVPLKESLKPQAIDVKVS